MLFTKNCYLYINYLFTILYMFKKEPWICRMSFGQSLDSCLEKVDWDVSTVSEGGKLGFKGNEVSEASIKSFDKLGNINRSAWFCFL